MKLYLPLLLIYGISDKLDKLSKSVIICAIIYSRMAVFHKHFAINARISITQSISFIL